MCTAELNEAVVTQKVSGFEELVPEMLLENSVRKFQSEIRVKVTVKFSRYTQ
jgi:hypothetical protein